MIYGHHKEHGNLKYKDMILPGLSTEQKLLNILFWTKSAYRKSRSPENKIFPNGCYQVPSVC
jgi:hypothetical protein